MIEWNDSTQLKTKKMPRPLCLLLVGLLAWTILINGTLKLQSQARKRKKGRGETDFSFSYYYCKRTLAKHSFSNIFDQFFKKLKNMGHVKMQGR